MNTTISAAQLLGQLQWRYATKQFDPARKISPELWSSLEEALVLSPSSGGLQPWGFVVVTDHKIREELVPVSYGQTQVKDASHLVVFAAKTHFTEKEVDEHLARTAEVRGIPVESLDAFRGMLVGGIVNALDENAREAWAAKQVYIALGNLLTSAALLGLDACPMEGFVPVEYDKILGLTEKGLTAKAICAVGYRSEADAYAALPKVRFPKEKVVFSV